MPLDQNPQSVPVAMPQWGAFKLAMLQNQAYQRVSAATSQQRAVSRIETYFSIEVENWPVASMFWQQMVTTCPLDKKPSAEDAGVWAVIARRTNMPISFNAEGYMEVLSQ
jgi:hypothetical protein